MKVLIEKLPLSENTSFVARTHRTPNFEVPWHQHVELEMILFREGAGLSFVGNYVGEFQVDDIYFLGPNLPHTFQKSGKLVTSAVVVQFREDFWGHDFLRLPESKPVLQLFETSVQGLKVHGKSKTLLKPLIEKLEHQTGFERVILLCQCLHIMAERKEYTLLSTQEVKDLNNKKRERIDQVFQFTMENFRKHVTLSEVAALAGLSVPAFCNYFKKSTKKKYIDFLNEIRIGYASKMLIDTRESINSICYESGFNTLAHFNKQFLKNRNMTPSRFRKVFLNAELTEQQVSLENREIREVKPMTFQEL
jgi:AraC-like DNA-binding protein